jgi:DNA-binding GntR family transcriptional regulator
MQNKTKPPRKSGATERALQQLLTLVMTGDLAPGEQVRQQEMAEHSGVSRVPLREALNVLAQQGLLVHKPNQGYFVAKRTQAELAQLRRMLHLMENEVMQSLDWPDAAALGRLRSLNERMRAIVDDPEWSEMPRLNREFHNEVLALSAQQLIVREIRRLYMLVDPFFAPNFEQKSDRATRVKEHEGILRALRSHDRQMLMAAVAAHRYPEGVGTEPSAPDAAA